MAGFFVFVCFEIAAGFPRALHLDHVDLEVTSICLHLSPSAEIKRVCRQRCVVWLRLGKTDTS